MLGPDQGYDGLYTTGPPSVHSSHGGRNYAQSGRLPTPLHTHCTKREQNVLQIRFKVSLLNTATYAFNKRYLNNEKTLSNYLDVQELNKSSFARCR